MPDEPRPPAVAEILVSTTAPARRKDRDVRALPDDELAAHLADVGRELLELRRRLGDAGAWRDVLETERDRRAIQRQD